MAAYCAGVVLFLATAPNAQVINGGFEDGTSNGWVITTGTYLGNYVVDWTTTPPGQPLPLVMDASAAPLPGQASNFDVDPYDGTFMLRINDTVGGKHATRVAQTITVSSADLGSAFHVDWGALLETGPDNHTAGQQSFFSIQVLRNGTIVTSFQADAELAAQQGWQMAGFRAGQLWYKHSAFNLLLAPAGFAVGDQLSVEMTVADCLLSGHGGCAYIDSASIMRCVPAPSGMIGWWPLDESAPPVAHEVISGLDGTYQGTSLPQPVPGVVDGGLGLDNYAISQWVSVPDDPLLHVGTGDFTIDAWVKVLSAGCESSLVAKGTSYFPAPSDIGFEWGLAPGGQSCQYLMLYNGAMGQHSLHGYFDFSEVECGVLFDAQWHHLAVVLKRTGTPPTGVTFYVDGLPIPDESGSAPIASSLTSNSPLLFTKFGGNGIHGSEFEGALDEVEFFNRALSSAEIKTIFDFGALGKCKPECNYTHDDAFEENDSCASAVALDPFIGFQGLYATKIDDDWYRIKVPMAALLTVNAYFVHAGGDIDMELYDACNGSVIALGDSIDDDEQIMWVNPGVGTRAVYLHIYVYSESEQDCNTYSLSSGIAMPSDVGHVMRGELSLHIFEGPHSTIGCLGGIATMSVTAYPAGVTYQWRHNGVPVPSQTNSVLTLVVSPGDGGSYDCVVRLGAQTKTSSSATLTEGDKPVITTQPSPTNQTVNSGATVTFSVTASGPGTTLSYQWEHRPNVPTAPFSDIPNETGTTLILPNVTSADQGTYRCRVTNECGTTKTLNCRVILV